MCLYLQLHLQYSIVWCLFNVILTVWTSNGSWTDVVCTILGIQKMFLSFTSLSVTFWFWFFFLNYLFISINCCFKEIHKIHFSMFQILIHAPFIQHCMKIRINVSNWKCGKRKISFVHRCDYWHFVCRWVGGNKKEKKYFQSSVPLNICAKVALSCEMSTRAKKALS